MQRSIYIHRLVSPAHLIEAWEPLGRLLLGVEPGDSMRQLIASPTSGCLYFTDAKKLWANDTGNLPRSARAAEDAARRFMNLMNREVAAASIQGSTGMEIFPHEARIASCQPVYAGSREAPDHWLCGFAGYVPTGLLPPQGGNASATALSAPVFGGRVDIRIGADSQVVGLWSNWRPVRAMELVELLPAQHADEHYVLMYQGGSHDEPQDILAPYYVTSGDDEHTASMMPASHYSLLVTLTRVDAGEGTRLSAAQQLSASYEAAPAVKGGQKIAIKQSYLFTDYNKSPSHEPGGLIEAARLYPLIRFDYPGAPGEKNAPERFRVDYRFDISLDGDRWDEHGASPNLAGVFADADGFNTQISSIVSRAYKPLPVEMVGNGLVEGRPGLASWDNIHHWAKRSTLPPTPGAANAAHSHWRWGPISASAPNGSHYSGLGGPLIDPVIPRQSLEFAITGRGPQPEVPAWGLSGASQSTLPFADLFTSGRSEPADIHEGSTLTQWWSFEATRSPEAAAAEPRWSGTLFVNGFFFAHGPEKMPGILVKLGHLADPLEKPALTARSRKSWFKP